MNGFKDLMVWQKGITLTTLVYELSKSLPESERYALCSQMQRAAVSIPSNIAEGQRRNNRKEYRHFCAVALGSAAELETQLIIVEKVYKTELHQEQELVIEIQKMLATLIKRLGVES